jgi:hypothetical protein
MKDMFGTFGKEKFVPKKADFYGLPDEKFGDDNIFIDIGKALVYLNQKEMQENGYVDLDKAWQNVNLDDIFQMAAEGLGEKGKKEYMILLRKCHKQYQTPFKNHRAYYGFTMVERDGKGLLEFTEKSVKNNKGENFKDNAAQVGFYILHYNKEYLGYKPKPAALAEEPSLEDKFRKINFFLKPADQVIYLGRMNESQFYDEENRDTEFCYLIAEKIEMEGKFLQGYLHDLWC